MNEGRAPAEKHQNLHLPAPKILRRNQLQLWSSRQGTATLLQEFTYLKASVFQLRTDPGQAQSMAHGRKDLEGLQSSQLALPLLRAWVILHIVGAPTDLHHN
jgi:hypothetical protein